MEVNHGIRIWYLIATHANRIYVWFDNGQSGPDGRNAAYCCSMDGHWAYRWYSDSRKYQSANFP